MIYQIYNDTIAISIGQPMFFSDRGFVTPIRISRVGINYFFKVEWSDGSATQIPTSDMWADAVDNDIDDDLPF